MFKTRKGRVVISVAVSVFLLRYIILQLHNFLSKNITTEFALSYEFDDKISADAYIIRDEEVVSAQTSGGVIGYCQQSGSKVQAESTVAEIFSAEQQAAAKTALSKSIRLMNVSSRFKPPTDRSTQGRSL